MTGLRFVGLNQQTRKYMLDEQSAYSEKPSDFSKIALLG